MPSGGDPQRPSTATRTSPQVKGPRRAELGLDWLAADTVARARQMSVAGWPVQFVVTPAEEEMLTERYEASFGSCTRKACQWSQLGLVGPPGDVSLNRSEW